jgi:hypothetical protein
MVSIRGLLSGTSHQAVVRSMPAAASRQLRFITCGQKRRRGRKPEQRNQQNGEKPPHLN